MAIWLWRSTVTCRRLSRCDSLAIFNSFSVVPSKVRTQLTPRRAHVCALQIALHFAKCVGLHLFRNREGRLQRIRNYWQNAGYQRLLGGAFEFCRRCHMGKKNMGQNVPACQKRRANACCK